MRLASEMQTKAATVECTYGGSGTHDCFDQQYMTKTGVVASRVEYPIYDACELSHLF